MKNLINKVKKAYQDFINFFKGFDDPDVFTANLEKELVAVEEKVIEEVKEVVAKVKKPKKKKKDK